MLLERRINPTRVKMTVSEAAPEPGARTVPRLDGIKLWVGRCKPVLGGAAVNRFRLELEPLVLGDPLTLELNGACHSGHPVYAG